MRKLLLLPLLLPLHAHAACPAITKLANQTHVCTIEAELGGQVYFGSLVHAVSRTGVTSITWTLFEGGTTGGPAEALTGTASVTDNSSYASSCSLTTQTSFLGGATSVNLASYLSNGAQLDIRGVRSDGLVFKATCLKP
jgi:hypothetical protein